jgi:hypothetical protein
MFLTETGASECESVCSCVRACVLSFFRVCVCVSIIVKVFILCIFDLLCLPYHTLINL